RCLVAELGRTIRAVGGQVRVREGIRADQLVVAGERRAEVRGVSAVAELARVRRDGRGQARVVGQEGVFRPDAGVDETDQDALAGVRLAAKRRPHRGGAYERGGVALRQRVLEVVFLDRLHTWDREQGLDLVGRDRRRDAAVDGRVARADRCRRDGRDDRGGGLDLLALDVALVLTDRVAVVLQRLAGLARARRSQAVDTAHVGGGGGVAVLEHHVDRVRARQAEQRRIGLGYVGRLGRGESRVRRKLCRRQGGWI